MLPPRKQPRAAAPRHRPTKASLCPTTRRAGACSRRKTQQNHRHMDTVMRCETQQKNRHMDAAMRCEIKICRVIVASRSPPFSFLYFASCGASLYNKTKRASARGREPLLRAHFVMILPFAQKNIFQLYKMTTF